jgi:hypothetical protein
MDTVQKGQSTSFSYRSHRRFDLAAMTERVLHATRLCTAQPKYLLRRAELVTRPSYSFYFQ